MTDKERLENINPIGFDLNGGVLLMPEDYYWLVEQAERVQELEQQNKRYREALEFYANEDNWVYGIAQHIFRGEKARQALEGEE